MLTKPFKPLALAFLVNLIISVEDKIKVYKYTLEYSIAGSTEQLTSSYASFSISLGSAVVVRSQTGVAEDES